MNRSIKDLTSSSSTSSDTDGEHDSKISSIFCFQLLSFKFPCSAFMVYFYLFTSMFTSSSSKSYFSKHVFQCCGSGSGRISISLAWSGSASRACRSLCESVFIIFLTKCKVKLYLTFSRKISLHCPKN